MAIAVSKLHEAGIVHNDISAKMFKVGSQHALVTARLASPTFASGVSAPAGRIVKPQTSSEACRSPQSITFEQ
jgi:hypothetical protein